MLDYTAVALADGTHTFTATAADPAGNTSPRVGGTRGGLYTAAPAAPAVTAVTAVTQDTGVPGDRVTADRTLTLTGAAEPGAVVAVPWGGTPVGTATASGAGTWGLDLTATALPDGTHTFTAVATRPPRGTTLEGTWTIISVVRNGNPLPEDTSKDARIVLRGETFTHKQGEKTLAKGTFRLDPGRKPGVIDLVASEGDEKGGTTPGIYALECDVPKICDARPGRGRPTKFGAGDGSDHTLVTRRRAKP